MRYSSAQGLSFREAVAHGQKGVLHRVTGPLCTFLALAQASGRRAGRARWKGSGAASGALDGGVIANGSTACKEGTSRRWDYAYCTSVFSGSGAPNGAAAEQ